MLGSEANREAAQRRARSYELLYLSLGRERSLTKLRQTLADLGLPVSLNTLKSYSSRYEWSEKARRYAEAHGVDDAALADTGMASRHADMAVAMQELAGRTLERLLEQPDLQLSVSEVCRLLDVGVRIERQARNADVSKHEVIVSVVEPFVVQIVALFEEVNVIEDAQVRRETWATRADGIMRQHVPPELLQE